MSTFTTEQLKKKWADYEDSESEDEFHSNSATKHHGHKKRGKDIVEPKKEESEEEEEEEEESESEEDEQLDLSRIKLAATQPKVEKKNRNLSKKEQLELKKKELEDLESLLAQYREDADPLTATTETEHQTEVVTPSEKQDGNADESKGKKKKKKKAGNKVESEGDVAVNPNETPAAATPSTTEPVDVTNILKSKVKKGSSSTKKPTTDPLKIAMEEALKSSSSKKKNKRDKSKFNEASY